jgi:Xaa-Pro aminopeptidase
MISKSEFQNRRKKVLDFLQDMSNRDKTKYKAVFRSGSQKIFSNDVKYPFRVDSDFYYLTGFAEADSILVLDPFCDHPYTLYVQPIDPVYSVWEGLF